jgi:hypothetical protein
MARRKLFPTKKDRAFKQWAENRFREAFNAFVFADEGDPGRDCLIGRMTLIAAISGDAMHTQALESILCDCYLLRGVEPDRDRCEEGWYAMGEEWNARAR